MGITYYHKIPKVPSFSGFRFQVFLFVLVILLHSGCKSSADMMPAPKRAMSVGGIIGSTGGPPFNPLSWHKVEHDVLSYEDAWGLRVKPRGIFQLPGGVGILYNSKPPLNYQYDGAQLQTGSLAFTRNLIDWHDYPGNPVMYEIQREWQGIWRVMPRAMLYDERNGQWVAYTGDADGPYPGIRAVGTAYSRDLVNWVMDENLTMTVIDYADEVAEHSGRSREEIIERGRIYAEWAIHYDDQYYLFVSGFIFVADEPGGPFRYYDRFKGDLMPRTRPAYWNGKWYTAITGSWDGKPGIGLAWSDNLMGPYELNPQNPIFEVETTSRARPQLVRHDGVWAVIYAHEYGGNGNRHSLRAALANRHPLVRIPDPGAVENPGTGAADILGTGLTRDPGPGAANTDPTEELQ